MGESLGNYKIVIANDKSNYISADYKNNELRISQDIKLNRTGDGAVCATFQNQEQQKPSVIDFVKELCGKKHTPDSSDCSVIISDPSIFNYCTCENAEYKLSGSGVTFNGTNNDDKLTLIDVNNSKINLGNGNDKVSIEGTSRKSRFFNNIVKTDDGNDTVNVSGTFNKFFNNQFYLGKGSDYFRASINPYDDAQTYSEFTNKLHEYGKTVAKNEIYAIDGYTVDGDKKGWFENNTFESKTYSANQLFKYDSIGTLSGIDGFQKIKFKPEPKVEFKQLTTSAPKHEQYENVPEAKNSNKKKREDYQNSVFYGSMLYMLFNNKEGLNSYLGAYEDYVHSMKH